MTRTRCLLITTCVVALLLSITPQLFAQTCLQDEFSTVAKQKLNCTANDVRIAEVSNVRDPATGATKASCVLGSRFDFIADFKVVTTANSTRSNIGMYIATASTSQALTGTCADNIIPPPSPFPPSKNGLPAQFPCANSGPASNILCGTNYYDSFDPAPDNCGDSSSTDNGGAPSTQIVTLLVTNYLCQPPAGTNQLVLPNCTSWQIPGGTIQCVAPLAQQSYPLNGPGGTPTAIPGTPSKCNCSVISLPVIAQTPSAVVQKECTTRLSVGPAINDPGNPNALPPVAPTQSPTSCDSGTEGADTVTYHVQVTNTSNFGSIIVNTLTDSIYGNIGGTCPGGSGATACTADSTTCTLPQTIAAGSDYKCTFTAHKYGDPEDATVTNKVTANGTSEFASGDWGPSNSNEVVVTPTEAPSAATVTKTLDSLRAASITARFAVEVKNTSSNAGCPPGGCDENETLTALSDSVFGTISPTPSSAIVATDCFTSTTGVSLPFGTGDYKCTYDVNIPLTALTPGVVEFGTGKCDLSGGSPGTCSAGKPNTTSCTKDSDCDQTCLGLSHTNYVNATINGDEGASEVVTPTKNTLHTSVCLVSFTQSQ